MDRPPYFYPDEDAMIALLHHYGIDAWLLQQAMAVLRKGDIAVLPLALSEAQRQAYFPLANGSRHACPCDAVPTRTGND
jgi:hypothetical protein